MFFLRAKAVVSSRLIAHYKTQSNKQWADEIVVEYIDGLERLSLGRGWGGELP